MDQYTCPRAAFGDPCSPDDPCIACWRHRPVSTKEKVLSVEVQGRFKGPANISSDSIQRFWETGEAEVFPRKSST